MTKHEVVKLIAKVIGVDPPEMSTGSTEPRIIFELINRQLGLGIEADRTKPEFARQIVECAGLVWTPDCESRGSTVTLKGLALVLDAVNFFVSVGTSSSLVQKPISTKADETNRNSIA